MKASERQQTPRSKVPRPRARRFVAAAMLMALLGGAHDAVACPVCFGDPESDMTRGAIWGIVVLGIVVYGVLMGMVGIGVTWVLRARRHVE